MTSRVVPDEAMATFGLDWLTLYRAITVAPSLGERRTPWLRG